MFGKKIFKNIAKGGKGIVDEVRERTHDGKDIIEGAKTLASEGKNVVDEVRERTHDGKDIIEGAKTLASEGENIVDDVRFKLNDGKIAKDECLICGQSADRNDQYAIFSILNKYKKSLADMKFHKNAECYPDGLQFLQGEFAETIDASYIEMKIWIRGKGYTIPFLRTKKSFDLVTHFTHVNGSQLNKSSYKFLHDYLNDPSSILVCFKELEGTPMETVPLVTTTNDPLVPRGLLESDEYKQAVVRAKRKMEMSLSVRKKSKVQETIVLAIFVWSTRLVV